MDKKGRPYTLATEKICKLCGTCKPIEDFYRVSNKDFIPNRLGSYSAKCKRCLSEQSCVRARNWSPIERAKDRATRQIWRGQNKTWTKFNHLLHTYKITLDQFHSMCERQDFACAICGNDAIELHVDHNHSTNKVRGLLCQGCNMGLGNFRDSSNRLVNAVAYLAKVGSYASTFTSCREE